MHPAEQMLKALEEDDDGIEYLPVAEIEHLPSETVFNRLVELGIETSTDYVIDLVRPHLLTTMVDVQLHHNHNRKAMDSMKSEELEKSIKDAFFPVDDVLAPRHLKGRIWGLGACAVIGAISTFVALWLAASGYEFSDKAQMIIAFGFLAGATIVFAAFIGMVGLLGYVYVSQKLEILRMKKEYITTKKQLSLLKNEVQHIIKDDSRLEGGVRTRLESALKTLDAA